MKANSKSILRLTTPRRQIQASNKIKKIGKKKNSYQNQSIITYFFCNY